jgi:hypothetical protein
VRFRFATDAAFLRFFFAALLCLVEAICHPISRGRQSVSQLLLDDVSKVCLYN